MRTRCWVKETKVPDSDVILAQTTLSQNGPRRSCSFGISVLTTRTETTSSCSKRKKQHCRRAVSTSTPALWQASHNDFSFTPFVLSLARSKKNRSFSSVTVSLIVEVTVEKQRSAPASAALKTARIRCTRSTCNVQQLREPIASDVVVYAQQSQPNCLFVTEMSTVHTPGSHMSCEMTTWHTSSRPPHLDW